MRELREEEINEVSGGFATRLSGYQGAGAVGLVLSLGAATGPLSPVIWGIGFGAMGGLAGAQFLADLHPR